MDAQQRKHLKLRISSLSEKYGWGDGSYKAPPEPERITELKRQRDAQHAAL